MITQRDAVRAALLHPLRWDSPDTPFKVDVCPASGRRLGWASHRVQLPFNQAAGGAFDPGVRHLQHELGELFGRKHSHFLFLRLLEYCRDGGERVGEEVDVLLGHRFAIVETPRRRAIAAYADLQTVPVCEDIILGPRF